MGFYFARVISRGRITVPAPLRRELGLKDGDEVELSVNSIEAAFGICGARCGANLEDMEIAVRRGARS